MKLFKGMMGKSLTGDEIKKMVIPKLKDQAMYELDVPSRAAEALGVKLERILGPGSPDDKLMVIWLETILANPGCDITPGWLSQKYNIPEEEMMQKLLDVSSRLDVEPHLKIIRMVLTREFKKEIIKNEKQI